MITPLKRKKFDELIPAVPTSDQYQYYWGSSQDVFRRILISVAMLVTFSLLYGRLLMFISAGLGGLYWMLGPVSTAIRQNTKIRSLSQCGFWEAKVLDVYLSEEVLSRQEDFDRRGRMEVSYDTQSFFNLELGDRTGFKTTLKAPMRREYKRIKPRQKVCMLLLSNDPKFRRVSKTTTDAYLPEINLWVSDYPYLRRDVFLDLTRYMLSRGKPIVDIEDVEDRSEDEYPDQYPDEFLDEFTDRTEDDSDEIDDYED
jgi:hypothetical protein